MKWFFVLLMFSLIGWSVRLLLVDSREISASAYNPANQTEEQHVIRGAILGANGEKLAYTETAEDGTETRVYPYGEALAHVVGYTGRGKSGLEATEDSQLTKASSLLEQVDKWANDEKVQGCDVTTTIDADLQSYAYQLMDGYRGAVVITEPSTGKTLTLMSSPSYDPSMVIDNWDTIAEREDSPLYARATQGLYAPGSTFKIVTALDMYRNMDDYDTYTYDCTGVLELANTSIACSNGEVHGAVGIKDAFAESCNGFFAEAAVKMGGASLKNTADYLKIGNDFNYELPQSTSQVVVSDNESEGMIGQTGIGQGETLMTPFSLNMLTCAIANGGALYQPYLVDHVSSSDGSLVSQNKPQLWGTVMTTQEAAFLESLMAGVTEYGTASDVGLNTDQYTVYGKTGTAQVEGQEDNSWFTCYVKSADGSTDLAITCIVEEGGFTKRAASVVSSLLQYYYNR